MTTTDTLDVIARRYSCRSYQDRPVPVDVLAKIAEAGLRAPSAKNRQPWRLIVVTDPSVLAEIEQSGLDAIRAADEEEFARVQARGGLLMYKAPAVIIIAAETLTSPYPVSGDVGIVASHMTLAAAALGVDSCIAARPGVAFQANDRSLTTKYLPAGFEFGLSVLLGYATEPGGVPHEPDGSKLTYL